MVSIDRAAIGFTIAIVVIGVGFAFYGDEIQSAGPSTTSPAVKAMPVMNDDPKDQMDPFADLADKVKSGSMGNDPMMMKDNCDQLAMMNDNPMMMKDCDPKMMKDDPMMAGKLGDAVSLHAVYIPVGTSSQGCEQNNSCYDPADIIINAGDTVEWINIDTAAHTVTSGSPTDGPSGVFDSSLVMADAAFTFTFDDTGSYDYFCLVHPWMVGSVTVN